MDLETCFSLWGLASDKLSQVTEEFHRLRSPGYGDPNPRLGCLSPKEGELYLQDCAYPFFLGIEYWTRGSQPQGSDEQFLVLLKDTVVSILKEWLERGTGDAHQHEA
jgi:hypothetical protein